MAHAMAHTRHAGDIHGTHNDTYMTHKNGTYKTVKARFWPWSLVVAFRSKSAKAFELFLFHSEADPAPDAVESSISSLPSAGGCAVRVSGCAVRVRGCAVRAGRVY